MTDKPINSFAEANQYLTQLYPNGRDNYDLVLMRQMMEYLGNPQDKYKSIHVAGTSGKTSTVYYMSALLSATGQKVGLTVSPHVDKLNERLQINNQPLPEPEFCQALSEFTTAIEDGNFKPSWFEFMIAFVFWYFAKAEVDYAVIEVGLGGLMDGTNVINRADKVCIITDIGLDHVNILGNTISEIATQKIGIAGTGNTVFTYPQSSEIMQSFKRWTDDNKADMQVVDDFVNNGLNPHVPTFQLRNWQLAYRVYEYLVNRDYLLHLTSQVLLKTQSIQVPGRMEIRVAGNKTLIMDGAHNAQKMATFVDSFKKLYPQARPAILLSLKDDKDYKDVVALLRPLATRFIITAFEAKQDMPSSSVDVDVLVEAFQKEGVEAIGITDQHQAYLELVNGPETVCIITGSFYLLGQIRSKEHLV